MLQVELSSVGTSILNLECDALPPDSNNEAIPLEEMVIKKIM